MRFLIALFICLPILVLGQNDLLFQAVYAYEQANYPEAIRSLSSLIESESQLSNEELPKAHFYLALAYWQANTDNKIREDFPQALLRAYNHIVAAQQLDKNNRYTQACSSMITLLLPKLYEAGTQAYNQQDYLLAIQYFDRYYQLEPNKSEALFAKAYAQWQIADSLSAINNWLKAMNRPSDQYQPQQENEFAHAYAMIVHTRSAWGQLSQAREILQQAFSRYPNHPSLIEAELDLYLSYPTLLKNGESHFQEQIDLNKGNLDWKRAYARYLYYQGDREKAISSFEQIQRLEPNHEMANRFLASHYVSKASQLLEELNQSSGAERSAKQELIFEALLESFLYLSKLHQEDPERIEWLEHLIAVSEYLDLNAAKEYRKELRKIR